MNIEELKLLRAQLESHQQYVSVNLYDYCDDCDDPDALSEARPLSEYIAQENTEITVKKFEEFVEKVVRTLTERNIDFYRVQFYSDANILCKANFVKTLQDMCEDSHNFQSNFEKLKSNISTVYVPISFGWSPLDIEGDYPQIYHTCSDLIQYKVSGIVNFNEFVKKIRSLGYTIDVNSFEEYLKEIEDYKFLTGFNISADLTKEKNDQENSSFGAK